MPAKALGIAALVFALLAVVAAYTYWFMAFTSPFFHFALLLATLAALFGDRWFTIATLAVCLSFLFWVEQYYGAFFPRVEPTYLTIAAVVPLFTPVAGLIFVAARKKKVSSIIGASLTLVFVLAGLQTLDFLRLGIDWGWERGGVETEVVRVPDDPCFARPDVLCVLDLARQSAQKIEFVAESVEGRVAVEWEEGRAAMLRKIAALQVEAGDAATARKTLTAAVEAAVGMRRRGSGKTGILRQIALLQAKVGDAAAARKTFTEAIKATEGRFLFVSHHIDALAEIAAAQIEAGDVAGGKGTFARTVVMARHLPSTRGLTATSQRIQSLSRIAKAQAAGDATASQATFAEALEAARTVQNIRKGWGAIKELALNLARTGDVEGALLAARGESTIVSDIARIQLGAGDIERALQIAESIEDDRVRFRALSGIAELQAKAGDVAGALETARRIEQRYDQVYCTRSNALRAVARSQAKAGDVAGALETARSIEDDRVRFQALWGISEIQAKAGHVGGALKTARSIEHDRYRFRALWFIAKLQAKAGDVAGALKTARSLEHDRIRWPQWNSIIAIQLKAGDVAGALEIARSIEDAPIRALVLTRIASVQAETGDRAAALQTLTQVREALDQTKESQLIDAYRNAIPMAHARAGDLEGALRAAPPGPSVVEIATAIAQAMVGDVWGARKTARVGQPDFSGAAVAFAEQNDFQAAVHLARLIDRKRWRTGTLGTVAILQATSGDLGGARDTLAEALSDARSLTNRGVGKNCCPRDQALSRIAAIQAIAGDEEAALETTRHIENDPPRARALRDIGIAKTLAGDLQGALLTVWRISEPTERTRALGDLALAIGSPSASPDQSASGWCALNVVFDDERAQRIFRCPKMRPLSW